MEESQQLAEYDSVLALIQAFADVNPLQQFFNGRFIGDPVFHGHLHVQILKRALLVLALKLNKAALFHDKLLILFKSYHQSLDRVE